MLVVYYIYIYIIYSMILLSLLWVLQQRFVLKSTQSGERQVWCLKLKALCSLGFVHNSARHAMKEHFCISRESDQDLTGFKLGYTTVVGDRNYWFKGAVCSPRGSFQK